MLEHAFYLGIERPMHLFWGVRSLRDLYMSDLPRLWEQQHPLFRFTPVLSEPITEDNWQGEVGFVHESVIRHYPILGKHDLYMSGPPIMIDAAREAFLKHGLPQEQMFSDAFEFNSQIDAN